ncbi:hypothetical protein WN55_04518 [Dufourea novaeangliae]|uniref:Uncharacterized protein n=1 Tax=Dufourea novaeangliae TaxID=178035 RepID=A0A154P2W9_DUFNO|nr:hypothetical protein WN55_04518 [Dufourea novaeangliae]
MHQALYKRPLQRMSSGEAPPAKTIPRVLDGALLSSGESHAFVPPVPNHVVGRLVQSGTVLRGELIGFGLVLRSMERPKLCWNHCQNHKAAAYIAAKSGSHAAQNGCPVYFNLKLVLRIMR